MNTCEVCKKNEEVTTVTLNLSFINVFWEGNAHADNCWKKKMCKECLQSLHDTIVNGIGSQNAFRDWRQEGKVIRMDE